MHCVQNFNLLKIPKILNLLQLNLSATLQLVRDSIQNLICKSYSNKNNDNI